MSHLLRTALQRLQATTCLSTSQFTPTQRRALDDYAHHTAAIVVERQGRGCRYRVANATVVAAKLQELAPVDESATRGLPTRAANIGRTRSSKGASHRLDCEYLLLKAAPGCVWQRADDTCLPLGALTTTHGAACLTVRRDPPGSPPWQAPTPLWLVENQELFDDTRWLPQVNAAVLWYRGQLSDLLLHWLAHSLQVPVTIHFPDYDGVGLANYLRLKQQMGNHVQFWLMPGWAEKLQRLGNNKLWRDTAPHYHAAVAGLAAWLAAEPELQALVTAMQHHGMALEQEAVNLSA